MREQVTRECWLVDVEEMNRQHPETFYIRSEDERTTLQVGDFAKVVLGFERKPNGCTGERPWIWIHHVSSVGGRIRYTGTIANVLTELESLREGDRVVFGPEHVADVDRRLSGIPKA